MPGQAQGPEYLPKHAWVSPGGVRTIQRGLDPFLQEPSRPCDGRIVCQRSAELFERSLLAKSASFPPAAQNPPLHPTISPTSDDNAPDQAETEKAAYENSPAPAKKKHGPG